MHFTLNRLALFCALFLAVILPARAVTPVFLTGSAAGQPDPYYFQSPFNQVPVGKTVVVPVVISGSGPMSYTATSSSPALVPIVKTGYPVMNIHVTYAGVTGSLNTLHTFTGGSDGGTPYAGVIEGSDGNFYGTTLTGTTGLGTVYQVTTGGTFTTLHSFTGGADGAKPYAGLIQATDGNLYGTTGTGGSGGAGTIFQITTSGSLTTLHSFTGGDDGGDPRGGVVQGSDGNFYGTTATDGTYGQGTFYQYTPEGTFTTLYAFSGTLNGGKPLGTLYQGNGQFFFGTASAGGGYGAGTVYQISTTGSLSTIYSFTGGPDGGSPHAGVIQGTDSNLYGTTETDGTSGLGTVFQITTTGSLTTLHTFTGGNDGANPYAPVVQASDGNFYGTTETDGTGGYGTVYQVTTSGSLMTLVAFTGSNGGNPYAGLVQGGDSNLYGTTTTSGTGGYGTVFKLPPPSNPFSGTMTFALLRDMAPVTSSYIAGFAQAGYYNNLDFFRITNLAAQGQQATYIAQGGDPTETGTGSPGFSFNNELDPSLIFWGQGQLAMANAGTDTTTFQGSNGTQFFITQNPLRSLDFNYTIFGQLLTGFDIMQDVMGVKLQSDGSSPVTPVVMDSVTVTEDNTDAILLINAAGANANGATIKVNATDPSGNKAVTVSGTTSTTGLSFTMATFDDTVNDPPIIEPQPNVFGALHQRVTVPVKAVDLEFDYLIPGVQAVSNPTGAGLVVNGNVLDVTPSPAAPEGTVTAGLYAYEPFIADEPTDRTPVTIGLGSGKLTGFSSFFTAPTGIGLVSDTTTNIGGGTPPFATFEDSNPRVGVGEFLATINWGDGSALSSGTGTVPVVSSTYLPGTYYVNGPDHIYKNPGIYPVNVTVTDTDGGVLEVQNTADVGPGPIYPFGRQFATTKGLANGLVATFVDHTSGAIPADYAATINWGDGSVGKGTIRGGNGSFQIYGKHQYTGGSTYAVDVTVNSTLNSDSGHAWSSVKLSGVPTHQPPFAQSHVNGQLGNPGYSTPDELSEEVTLFNSGDLPSGVVSLKFYLSPDSSTQPINSAAIPLSVDGKSTYQAASIPAGGVIAGSVSDIGIPAGVPTRDRYLIMQVITNDPIGSHMDYPRAFADPDPLIE